MSKKITIIRISLRNFKAIKSFDFTPNQTVTNVLGANRSGKTTLATSFTWLLWGKDLQDRKDFEIKTLDENNQVIHQLEHEVTAIIEVEGIQHTLRRVYYEKWQKKRGEENKELTGHTTDYYWNEVPLKASEYEIKIKDLFGSEDVYKLLTNPYFFNTFFKPDQRREMLIDLAGAVTDDELAASNPSFSELIAKLSGKTFDEYKAQINSQKRKIKETLETIPSRLDEIDRMMPEQEPDYLKVQAEIDEKQNTRENIISQLADKAERLQSYYDQKSQWVENCSKLKQQIKSLELDAESKGQEAKNDNARKIWEFNSTVQRLQLESGSKSQRIKALEDKIQSTSAAIDKLRDDYKLVYNSKFEIDPNRLICHACKREFEADKRESLILSSEDSFNKDRSEKLARINENGSKLNKEIETLKTDIEKLQSEITQTTNSIIQIETERKQLESANITTIPASELLKDDQNYHGLKQQLQTLEANPVQQPTDEDKQRLEQEKKEIDHIIESLKQQLQVRETVNRLSERKSELLTNERSLNQELANLEKDEFTISNFETAKSNALQEKVNKLFTTVKFKLFEQQINGGFRNICETLVNGVPWAAANTAAQVQSGLDIINVFQKHYGLILPVFCDASESVTEIPFTQAQTIRLFVSPNHKSLTVQ